MTQPENNQEEKLISYRFRADVIGDAGADYEQWMQLKRIRKIMDQKDENNRPLLLDPKLTKHIDEDGSVFFVLQCNTTDVNWQKYSARVTDMKAHTQGKYGDMTSAEFPLKFNKKLSTEEGYEALLNGKNGQPVAGEECNLLRKADYSVRVEISDKNLNPPYEEWIKEHVQEMMELKDKNGDPCFAGARIRKASEGDKDIYVIDYKTTNMRYWNYENEKAMEMRSKFTKTYSDPSVFRVTRSLLEDGADRAEKIEHTKQYQGSGGRLLSLKTLASVGVFQEKMVA